MVETVTGQFVMLIICSEQDLCLHPFADPIYESY